MPNLTEYIQTFNNILPEAVHSKFLKSLDFFKYETAKVVGDSNEEVCNTSVRDVKEHSLSSKLSATSNHWYNLLNSSFEQCLKIYHSKYKMPMPDSIDIQNISILKYELNGKYEPHVDDGPFTPRTLSCIYFLNDNYSGGELNFLNHMNSEVYLTIKPKKNSLVIWPSNFLYPHGVKPVTQGTRYTVVAWIR